jgi:hypothetical protein
MATPTSTRRSITRAGAGSENRLGEFFRRKTLMFNGYADQVASLYREWTSRSSTD